MLFVNENSRLKESAGLSSIHSLIIFFQPPPLYLSNPPSPPFSKVGDEKCCSLLTPSLSHTR